MTNYEKTKLIIRALYGAKLTGCEASICFYLINELFGYKEKKTDSSSYHHIAQAIHYSDRQVKYSIANLVNRRIVQRITYATKYGNSYAIYKPENWLPTSEVHCTVLVK